MSSWSSILGIVLGMLLTSCSEPTPAKSPPVTPSLQAEPINSLAQELPISARAIIGDRTINLEVAQTQEQQATGLMYRNTLADDRGMLFLFAQPQQIRFWMKNVSIPLDMIFLRDNQVKAIAASVPPCTTDPCPTYGSATDVDRVIELRGGLAKELGLKVGEKVEINFLNK